MERAQGRPLCGLRAVPEISRPPRHPIRCGNHGPSDMQVISGDWERLGDDFGGAILRSGGNAPAHDHLKQGEQNRPAAPISAVD